MIGWNKNLLESADHTRMYICILMLTVQKKDNINFHGLNILLSAYKFASFWVKYSFDFKALNKGIIYTVKKVYLAGVSQYWQKCWRKAFELLPIRRVWFNVPVVPDTHSPTGTPRPHLWANRSSNIFKTFPTQSFKIINVVKNFQ